MTIGFNLSYALTRFEQSIPDTELTDGQPVVCPNCKQADWCAESYPHTNKCSNCGMLYRIVRGQSQDTYSNGERIPEELPF